MLTYYIPVHIFLRRGQKSDELYCSWSAILALSFSLIHIALTTHCDSDTASLESHKLGIDTGYP